MDLSINVLQEEIDNVLDFLVMYHVGVGLRQEFRLEQYHKYLNEFIGMSIVFKRFLLAEKVDEVMNDAIEKLAMIFDVKYVID